MKTKLRLFTLLIVLQTGWISAQNIVHVDKELRLPLQRALLEFKKIGVEYDPMDEPFVLMFGSTRGQAAAVSMGKNKEGVLIFVNRNVFNSYSLRSQVWIIIHELAHDVFNLEHSHDGVMVAEIPNAINKELWEEGMNILKEQINHTHE